MAAVMDPADKWLLMQTLGDKPTGMLVDGDVVSAVEFDHKGDFLATGDRGGRVRIYEKCDVEDVEVAPNARRTVGTSGGPVGTSGPGVEYRLWHEFQSHEGGVMTELDRFADRALQQGSRVRLFTNQRVRQ
ncbi:hypothetical protein T484DRAFT_1828857 [Baffinella frigidus]|nr:hypothetical protein T484DRAFT_1828857 [Cryptophyta sp. CCMP2293]